MDLRGLTLNPPHRNRLAISTEPPLSPGYFGRNVRSEHCMGYRTPIWHHHYHDTLSQQCSYIVDMITTIMIVRSQTCHGELIRFMHTYLYSLDSRIHGLRAWLFDATARRRKKEKNLYILHQATLKKVCFLSNGWHKLWQFGRPQIFYIFFLLRKLLKYYENWEGKKRVPSRH